MRKKLVLFSIGAVVLLILTCIPSTASQLPRPIYRNDMNPEPGSVTLKVYHYK